MMICADFERVYEIAPGVFDFMQFLEQKTL
jgi:hypothetical protein